MLRYGLDKIFEGTDPNKFSVVVKRLYFLQTKYFWVFYFFVSKVIKIYCKFHFAILTHLVDFCEAGAYQYEIINCKKKIRLVHEAIYNPFFVASYMSILAFLEGLSPAQVSRINKTNINELAN